MSKYPLKRRGSRMKPWPVWAVFSAHILALGVALLLFALPHHVVAREEKAVGLVSSRDQFVQPTVSASPTPTVAPTEAVAAMNLIIDEEPMATLEPVVTLAPTPTPEPTDEPGSFRIKFADKFTDGEVVMTDTTYKNANVNITFGTLEYENSKCHIADIYIADITCLATAFGEDTYGRGYTEYPTSFAKRFGALAVLSGDYYGARSDGVVIRNGTLYRDKRVSRDVCVLYWDGTMRTFARKDFNAKTEMANGAYQAWNFGPRLLEDDGRTKKNFNSDVVKTNPRAAIGYFEPGHYCFIMVDGRSSASRGLTMAQLSSFVGQLGCTVAYNLDGGQSAALVKAGQVYGNPVNGGRKISDVVMILPDPVL